MDDLEEMLEQDQDPFEEEGLTLEDIHALVSAELDDAISYIESEVGPERAEASLSYQGAPYGDEEEGRSQIVMRDVHDTVQWILPQLMEILFDGEHPLRFVESGPDEIQDAELETEYVRQLLLVENNGVLQFHTVFKDALLGTGAVKWWWDEGLRVSTRTYTGREEQIGAVASDPRVEIVSQAPSQKVPGMYEITFRFRDNQPGRVRFSAVPPEEVLINRGARGIYEGGFTVVAHQVEKQVHELLAMGYDQDEVEEHAGESVYDSSQERLARDRNSRWDGYESDNPMAQTVVYTEVWMYLQLRRGDSPELYKVCCLGPKHRPVRVMPASHVPIAIGGPDPVQHSWRSESIDHKVGDLQRINTAIVRAQLDSLVQTLFPRMGVVEDKARMEDVLNTEMGAPIRMDAPGMVTPLVTPFVGKEAFPMLDFMQGIREDRVGFNKAAMGLNAEALQSSTRIAVAATLGAAQMKVKLIAHLLALQLLVPLYKGIHQLLCEHQTDPIQEWLGRRWVTISPSRWSPSRKVGVEFGLGGGGKAEQLAALEYHIEKQIAAIAEYGPGNGMVTVGQLRHSLVTHLRLSGFKNPDLFYAPLQPTEDLPKPPAPEGEGPDQGPAMLAQAQIQEAQIRWSSEQDKLALEREKMYLEDDRERDRAYMEFRLKAAEIEFKYEQAIDLANIKAEVDRERVRNPGPSQDPGAGAT